MLICESVVAVADVSSVEVCPDAGACKAIR